MLVDDTKKIDGDIVWRQHPDIDFSVSFRATVVASNSEEYLLSGYYNRENKKFSLNLFRAGEKPFLRLCMASGHHNPSCAQAGDPHLHQWDDQNGDKIAGAVVFDVHDGMQQIWRSFCAWAKIQHNGTFESPPPQQPDMFP